MAARALLFLMVAVNPVTAGLTSYPELLVADPALRAPGHDSVRMTYLGTNGYQFETAGHSLLVDPYFSRIGLSRIVFGLPLRPNAGAVAEGMSRLKPNADAILVTHAHFDHLFDVPTIMGRTGARLIGSSTAVELARRTGADPDHCTPVQPGSVRTIGPWHIRALPASHDHLPLIGVVPFNRPMRGTRPPVTARDWVCGEPLSYLITASGVRIFIDSGGSPAVLPPPNLGRIDLAILGVALPDARARLAATTSRLQARYILPSHQDNFFVPLDRGFRFGPLTDFEFVRREHQRQGMAGRLVLLDYYQPWTLSRP